MDDRLAQWLIEVRDDPLAFVMGAFPWGEKGTQLEGYDGPMPWAIALMGRIKSGLTTIDEAIMEAVASGHGIAKSTTVAQLILWAFMTFPDTRGVVTANTEPQLKTKTWAELGKWFNLCWFAREYFTLTATALLSKDKTRERTWRIDMIPWSKTNPQAFAGLHNKGKRMLLVFDNPTRNFGRFRECFDGGKHNSFWHTTQIDSREVPITNKKRIEHLISIYGLDSDYTRVRILGQFPH